MSIAVSHRGMACVGVSWRAERGRKASAFWGGRDKRSAIPASQPIAFAWLFGGRKIAARATIWSFPKEIKALFGTPTHLPLPGDLS